VRRSQQMSTGKATALCCKGMDNMMQTRNWPIAHHGCSSLIPYVVKAQRLSIGWHVTWQPTIRRQFPIHDCSAYLTMCLVWRAGGCDPRQPIAAQSVDVPKLPDQSALTRASPSPW
jgi:hypothetical protein